MVFITLATLIGLGVPSLPDGTQILITSKEGATSIARGEIQDFTLNLKINNKNMLPGGTEVKMLIVTPQPNQIKKGFEGITTNDGKDILLDFGTGRNSFRKILSENYKIRLKFE
ncbi:hypothetical protein [Deinococcus roseus]|uniref:Uncharacterized protein n=1 Tax=Deinococcus roseus TaxID=392414 RepID=A0ABQ2D0R6_9DEIO|nr:hypothetical protein [Deinococcus roseus]GGJ38099.1 hypothetical protein GCM10008938_25280 [Deinococcus roseus]